MKSTAFLLFVFLCLGGSFMACNQLPAEEETVEKTEKKATYARDELTIQSGLTLFNQHCASCHNFSENGIGPNLMGITAEVDKEWLAAFIKNAPEVIESGDERAKELFEKYKQYMPPFAMLEDDDIEHLLGFIHKFSAGEKRNHNNRPGGILNPIVAKIPTADLTLVIEEWMTIPASATTGAKARINKLLPLGKERLFIIDLRGEMYEIQNKTAKKYMDMKSFFPDFVHNPGHGSGLGSFAFHPDFNKNGLFYTTHTEPGDAKPADFPLTDSIKSAMQGVVTEWKVDQPSAKEFSGSKREILRADMVSRAHGMQELTFNPLAKMGDPDYGILYLGIGDGGAALRGYPFLCDNNGQIWSAVLRIDPLGSNSANGQYGIPPDNPFVKDPAAQGEVWATGFRNPHRISWDETGSGKMFITNIGQHSVEELNLGKAGADYGWPEREGDYLFDVEANPELVYPLPEGEDEYTYPPVQYDHDEGNAISGGFVYAGTAFPELKGKYIFGDIPRGTIFYSDVAAIEDGKKAPIYKLQLEFNGEINDLGTIADDIRVQLRLGLDNDGELYLFTKSNGVIYKVVGCKKGSTSI